MIAQTYQCFAYNGAVIDSRIVRPGPHAHPDWEDFGKQVGLFRDWTVQNDFDFQTNSSLSIVVFGINDVKNMAREHPRENDTANIIALAASVQRNMAYLYSLGLRNFLLSPSTPIDLTPQATLSSKGGFEDRFLTKQLNERLNALLRTLSQRFEQAHPGANVMYFDQDAYIRIIYEWPELFGVTDIKRFMFMLKGEMLDRGRVGFL
ncbi:hypothetical protein JCM24511_10172 [Saitozyma sp. JCM 24511]|nr:hypothetical protein JCM24511_10172 [Saitozyma sp. JCM 24511]